MLLTLSHLGIADDRHDVGVVEDDEYVDRSLAVTSEPIIGTDKVMFDDATGPSALEARPLPSPKGMGVQQRAVHNLTHLPYGPSCEYVFLAGDPTLNTGPCLHRWGQCHLWLAIMHSLNIPMMLTH